ncbi:MAG: LysR substrate-binding domain-containing protein [Terriglobales bacterium]
MYMEIAELRSFLALADELHFRKAAEKLFLSQPALSKQIRRLEDKAGGALFARTRRKVVLTETGKVLRPLAAKLVADAHSAMNLTREAADGRAGALNVGFGIAAVSEILPRTILRFQKAYPHIELRMRDMSTPSQVAALLDGTLDIGILRLPIAHAELQSISLFRERLVLAAPPSVAYKPKEGLATMRKEPFIFLPRLTSATFHDHVLGLCRRAGFTPHIVQEASEMFTILNFVRSGLGVSLVPSAAIRMNVPGVRFHELRIPEAEWLIGTASHRLSEKRELISRFTSAIRAVVRGRGSHR